MVCCPRRSTNSTKVGDALTKDQCRFEPYPISRNMMLFKREYSLHQYLMAFGTALLVPILGLAAISVGEFARAEKQQNEQRAQAAAEQIIADIDQELGRRTGARQLGCPSSQKLREISAARDRGHKSPAAGRLPDRGPGSHRSAGGQYACAMGRPPA